MGMVACSCVPCIRAQGMVDARPGVDIVGMILRVILGVIDRPIAG